MSPRSIDNDNFKAFLLEFGDTLCCNGDRIRFRVRSKVSYFGLGCRLPGLVESTGTESVCADYGRLEATLLIMDSELRARRCFSITLH